jgi:hypothetical protein
MELKRITCLTNALLILAVTAPAVRAGEPAVNPVGTWKVTVFSTDARQRLSTNTLKLKLDNGTLTGTLSYKSGPVVNGQAPVSELPITEVRLQGDRISFNFTHPPAYSNHPDSAANLTYSYEGKISGGMIKGTFIMEFMGDTHTRNWQAERLKE